MRYPASEKLEIIRLVEQWNLRVRRTLATLAILPGTFYRWYDRLQSGGPEAWKTDHCGPGGCRTASPMMFASRSSSLLSKSPSCRPERKRMRVPN